MSNMAVLVLYIHAVCVFLRPHFDPYEHFMSRYTPVLAEQERSGMSTLDFSRFLLGRLGTLWTTACHAMRGTRKRSMPRRIAKVSTRMEKMRRRRRLEKRVAVSMGPAIYEKASAYQMK